VPAERQSDREIIQAIEEVQDALRLEHRALGSLPRETARLRERSEQLQAEREALHGELEALRQGKPKRSPRLPEHLVPPFEVRAQVPPRRRLREAVPSLIAVGLLLWTPWDRIFWPFAIVGLAMAMAMLLVERSSSRPRCRFEQTGIDLSSRDGRRSVSYTNVLDAEVYISLSQHQRGVGTVVVTHKPLPGESEGTSITLKDVPEPERLAEWIRSMRPQKK
jgi:hypothetical protein